MNLQKPPPPIRDRKHLAFVRAIGCVLCYRPAEAAHVRYGDMEQGKPHTPMSRQPGDNFAVPLCSECHRDGPDAQHKSNERAWWVRKGIDPLKLAAALYEATGNYEQACAILRGMHERKETA